MCTVSWVSAKDGYTFCFNRDERHTRAPAVPPAERETGGVRYLAPLDGDSGGTWLAVNELGLTLALLNRYRVPGYQSQPDRLSRGLLIPDLIGEQTEEAALRRLEGRDLSGVEPFSLVTVEPGRPVRIAAWDGGALTALTHRSPGLILTSSSVAEPEVALARRAAFGTQDGFTPAILAALHRSHLPEQGRCSICMHREDAETQSYTAVTVTPEEIQLDHTAAPPCRGIALPTLHLPRRVTPIPTAR